MDHDISPAVERAADTAAAHAARLGATGVRLVDWLLGLLDEDEGRPTVLLARLGVDVPRLREELPAAGPDRFPAPSRAELFTAARNFSIRLRGEPSLTTDVVMLAVLAADPEFAESVRRSGVSVPAVEAALLSPMIVPPSDAPPPDPGPAFALPEPADRADAARVVDANLNRARESLRVLDDYARFVLNDAVLTAELKKLRHQLAEAAGQIPVQLLAARDTPGDVGTAVTAGAEYDRGSPRQVAAVNFKRLQESLRSVEEYGKLFGPPFAREVEQLRYAAYTLERAVIAGADSRERLAGAKLYVLLTGAHCAAALDWTIAEAAAGGADVIQLREKALSDRELLDRARNVRRWTRKANVLFVINDRPDVARLAEADGVHLGQDDLPVHEARRILGPGPLIGVSTHTVEQVRRAVLDGADYIGVGPTFPSKTKDFAALAGLEFVAAAARATSLPAFVLGGVNQESVGRAVAAGAKRIAVSAAVAAADDPRQAAAALRASLP